MIIGCGITIFIIVLAAFPSVIASQTTTSKYIQNHPIINNLLRNANDEIKTKINERISILNDGWHLGFFLEILIGTIFIFLILLGILLPS